MYRRSLPYCQPPPGFSSGQRVRSSRDPRSVSVSSGTRIVNGDVGIVIILFPSESCRTRAYYDLPTALATLDIEIPGFCAMSPGPARMTHLAVSGRGDRLRGSRALVPSAPVGAAGIVK